MKTNDIKDMPKCCKCGCLLKVNEGVDIKGEWFCDSCYKDHKIQLH
jgi:formylmethanofuran dehydrogenase subunit E